MHLCLSSSLQLQRFMRAMLKLVRRKGIPIINIALKQPSSPFSTSTSDANAIIHILTSSDTFAEATFLTKQHLQNSRKHRTLCSSIFQSLNRAKLTPQAFDVLVLAFCQLGLVEEALWVFKNHSFLPTLQPSNALLHGIVKTQISIPCGRCMETWCRAGFVPLSSPTAF